MIVATDCLSVCHSIYSSPIGELLLESDGEALTGLTWLSTGEDPASGPAAGLPAG